MGIKLIDQRKNVLEDRKTIKRELQNSDYPKKIGVKELKQFLKINTESALHANRPIRKNQRIKIYQLRNVSVNILSRRGIANMRI